MKPVGLRTKMEPEGRRSQRGGETERADGSEVCGADRATSDQGGARGTREPGGAVRTMVSRGAEGAKTEPKGSTDRGGVTGSVAGGGARGSSWLGGVGDLKTQGRSTQKSAVRGGVEGLKGTSRGGADGLADLGRGGRVGTLETQKTSFWTGPAGTRDIGKYPLPNPQVIMQRSDSQGVRLSQMLRGNGLLSPLNWLLHLGRFGLPVCSER